MKDVDDPPDDGEPKKTGAPAEDPSIADGQESGGEADGDTGSMEQTVDLVRQAQSGDERALNDLVERYLPRVEAIVRTRLGRALRRDLESGDVVQETLIKVLGSLENFEQRDERSFIRWVSKIVENQLRQDARFFNALRRDRKREIQISSDDSSVHGVPEPRDDGDGPASAAEKAELVDQMRAARSTLSENHRQVLALWDGTCSWADVATAMGLASPDAARQLWARAQTALMRAMRREEP